MRPKVKIYYKVAEFIKPRRKRAKGRDTYSLSPKQWKQYYEILEKQLQGKHTTKEENRLQAKGDSEINKSLQGIAI